MDEIGCFLDKQLDFIEFVYIKLEITSLKHKILYYKV